MWALNQQNEEEKSGLKNLERPHWWSHNFSNMVQVMASQKATFIFYFFNFTFSFYKTSNISGFILTFNTIK